MAGDRTPFPMAGEETPRVPRTPADGEVWSEGEATPGLGGDQTPQVPRIPTRGALQTRKMNTPVPGDETPAATLEAQATVSIPTASKEKEEGITPAGGEETPRVPRSHGEATPMGGQTPAGQTPHMGGETPMLPPPGVDVPAMPPGTPQRRGSASATAELTPGWDGAR